MGGTAFDQLSPAQLRRRKTIKWSLFGPDVLPLWIAEMDFPTAPAVLDGIRACVANEEFGYPPVGEDDLPKATADWCLCTIPLSILSQLPINVGAAMKAAIDAVPYAGSVKVGLQFKRRFWEEDDAIYGGISYTDLPIRQIAYPNSAFNRGGKGVLLRAYLFEGANAYEFTAMSPEERVARAGRARGAGHSAGARGDGELQNRRSRCRAR